MMINNSTAGMARMSLGVNAANGARTMQQLSSGLRINSARDDAAGLAIAERMNAQIRGLNMASRNASDSISMIRTGEGALAQTHENLQRMRELAVQATNGIYTASDRRALQAEMSQLTTEIDRIGNTTEFNTRALLNGTSGGGVDNSLMSQIGANSGQTAFTSFGDMRSQALGVDGLDISTAAGAAASLEAIDAAIEAVSSQRGAFGATENRFEHTVRNLDNAAENQQAAQSRIRDADMARLAIQRATEGILRQTSIAMLSQANMMQSNIMRLLG